MLSGAWRVVPPVPDFDRNLLDEVRPQLLASGAAGLVWRKIRGDRSLADSPAADVFRDWYRSNALNSARQQHTIAAIFSRLTESNVKPIIVKGWSIARLYPELAARPAGDIDLYVAPEDRAKAEQIVRGLLDSPYHADFEHLALALSRDTVASVFARSELCELHGVPVRVLCAEDNLRLLAVHYLQHGGWRPLWLCDVAVALENRPPRFDWKRCLGNDPVRINWVESVLVLAHLLLGARIDDTPAAGWIAKFPQWPRESILEKWGRLSLEIVGQGYFPSVGSMLQPGNFIRAIKHRWDDPIRATVEAGGRFDNSSRLPLKIRWGLKRAAQFYFSGIEH